MLAPFVYMRLSKTWNTRSILKLVIALMFVSFVLMMFVGPLHPALLLLAFAPYALSEGIARPAAFLVLLDKPSSVVGTASAIGNFSYGVITAFATVAAALPWPSFMFGLTALILISALGAAGLYVLGHDGWSVK